MIVADRPRCKSCERPIKYGEIGVFPLGSEDDGDKEVDVEADSGVFCERCAEKQKLTGEAKIIGGDNPSSVDRARAAKNTKRFERKVRI